MSNFPPEWRAQIKVQYIQMGAPADEADQIIDLAVHAVNQALEAIGRVADSAEKHVDSMMILLACQLASHRFEQIHQSMQEFLSTQDSYRRVQIDLMSPPQGSA